MIPINNAALYDRALSLLSGFVRRGYRSRIVQIFLAAKYHGPAFPQVGSGRGIQVDEVQALLDDFYRKNSRDDGDGSIAMIFQNNHLVPTGQLGPELNTPSNIWRNNFGLQKATICYATETELSNNAFLAASRLNCPHLVAPVAGSLANAKCALNMEPSYRREDGPRVIRRDPVDNAISIVNPANATFWREIVAPEGRRLPVAPIVAVLYHDANIGAGRSSLDPMDFVRDFNFSSAEYHAYFDDDPAHPVHAALIAAFPGLTWGRVPGVFGVASPATPGAPDPVPPPGPLDPDTLPVLAPRTAPPAGGHWWSAEQAVQKYLEDSGWNVINRTGQAVGFDIEIWRPGDARRRYVEVKSSVGPCSPALTRNEFEAATRYGTRYTVAIVENFDPDGDLAILWVNNPAALPIIGRDVRQYPIPRAVWLKNAKAAIV